MLNLVVLDGVLARPAQDAVLPSGSRLLTLDVTVKRAGEPTDTVPVAWFDAPAWATELDAGIGVVVTGRVRRRFFRTGGAVQSRTEVVAARVVRTASKGRARSLLADAAGVLDEAAAAD